MKHIKTINAANLKASAAKGGCGKCQASCHYQLSASIHSKHPIKYTLYFHKIENSISTLVKS